MLIALALAPAVPPVVAPDLSVSEALFRAGHFEEARPIYADAARFGSADALRRLGQIELFENRLRDAERDLLRAHALRPDNRTVNALLGETYYRKEEFARAAPYFRAARAEGIAVNLAAFGNARPYRITMAGEASLPFLPGMPLPVVQLRLPKGRTARFFIDTGGSEVILDGRLAASLGVASAGSHVGSFAGGKTATVQHGRLAMLGLGSATVRDLPIMFMDLSAQSATFPGGIEGCLGTTVLSKFLATLDYPGQRLVLRNRKSAPPVGVGMPFWMAGDHYIVTWGQLNAAPPTLLFVDTGLAGGGFTGPRSTLEEAGVKLDAPANIGVGGGGAVSAIPFRLDRLSLWTVSKRDIKGVCFPAFPLENAFGFRIGGIISQDFFRDAPLTFDFSRMRLVIGHS